MSVKRKETAEYKSSLTKRKFLFREMRITAKLMLSGLPDDEIVNSVERDNLYQYRTEGSLRTLANYCVQRLRLLDDESLVRAVAEEPAAISGQICLYSMMLQNLLVRDFMISVIGEKYRTHDFSFRKTDVSAFFLRLQEQNAAAALWGDATVARLKQELVKILAETGYLDTISSETLNSVLIEPILFRSIEKRGDLTALPAFNCF